MTQPSPPVGLSEERLLPCPFCGGTLQTAIDRTCDRNTLYNPADFAYPRVICRCGAEVPGENWGHKKTAITAWNRRAAEQQEPVACRWRERDEGHWNIWRYQEGRGPSPSENVQVELFFASPPPVPAGVSEEDVERAAEGICRATHLEWDSLPDSGPDDELNNKSAETKGWFRYLARAALLHGGSNDR